MQTQIANEINKYDDFMLTSKMIARVLSTHKSETNNKNKNTETKTKPIINNNFFIPKEKDGLFWCFFVIKNGFAAYEYPGATSFVSEKDAKFKLIESMRTKKQILKKNKIKNIKEDVEDELANKNKIGMKTFIALCASENINVLFIHKRKCFQLICEEENSFHVIHQYDNPEKYCYESNITPETLEKYRTTLFNWESLEKPLKAISAYKVNELLDLCKKLGLEEKTDNLNKKSKKDLYELLIMNL